jgi:hypothetical protein
MNPRSTEHDEGSVDRGPTVIQDGDSGFQKTSFSYSIDQSEERVWASFTGNLTFEAIAGYADRLVADRQFDPRYVELVDLRSVERVTISAEELIRLADQVDPFEVNSKRAFVAQSQDQIRAARLHQLLRPGNKNMRIFTSLADAKRWLRSD